MGIKYGLISEVTIRRLSKIFPVGLTFDENSKKKRKGKMSIPVYGAFLANLAELGYWLNVDASYDARYYSRLTASILLESLQKLHGVADYKPMYPNFPEQVAEASDTELYLNAIIHYFGNIFGENLLPPYDVKTREPLDEMNPVTVLGVVSAADMENLVKEIATQGQPFSEQDLKDLELLSEVVQTVKFPQITVKENVAKLALLFPSSDFTASIQTATDVLRLAVVYSGGDVSLSENTRFKLSRPQRRQIIELLGKVLENSDNNLDDFVTHLEPWKRLAYGLHYKEFGNQRINEVFKKLYSGRFKTFNGKVEKALKKEKARDAILLLTDRPGVFARRLAEMLRKYPDSRPLILEMFGKVSHKVSVRVLVQLWNHFNGPTKDVLSKTTFNIKTKVGQNKTGVKDNTLAGDQSDVIAVIEKGLRGRFGKKIYLETDGNDYAVPLGNRSASTGLNIAGRGSRIKLSDEKSTIRLFAHWKNIEDSGFGYDYNSGRVDLDLSAYFMNDDFSKAQTISYYNLRENGAYHSGDITSAPEGAAEFIDIDISKNLEKGWRYVVLSVYSYNGQTFNNVPEAWAGVMLREEPNSGEIFEVSTVSTRFDLTAESKNSTPLVFDMLTREMIWWDSSISTTDNLLYNVDSNESRTVIALKSIALGKFMTVEKLVELVASEKVDDRTKAETIIEAKSLSSVLQLLS